jgi:hypothetical protein
VAVEAGPPRAVLTETDVYDVTGGTGHRARVQVNVEVVFAVTAITVPGGSDPGFHIVVAGVRQLGEGVRVPIRAVAHHRRLVFIIGVAGQQVVDRRGVMDVAGGDGHLVDDLRTRAHGKVRFVAIEFAVMGLMAFSGDQPVVHAR